VIEKFGEELVRDYNINVQRVFEDS
jgi:hypothetical protein